MKQIIGLFVLVSMLTGWVPIRQPLALSADATPPASPVKLVFIHHSCGGNWLADPASNPLGGGLGWALMENNYFVSATNYGWGPDSIGDATEIPNWLDWFRGERSPAYLEALYHENQQNIGDFGSWPRLSADPGGENQIILFKSCFPSSDLAGSPQDAPAPEGWLSVSNAKYVYNEILKTFATHPDKLFVVVTAPPLQHSAYAANARAFNLWLVHEWLSENQYALNNVAVFDYYNVLSGPDNHHRVVNGEIQHTYMPGQDLLYYPSSDDHPSQAGNSKATQEFLPLLNSFYNRWRATIAEGPVEIHEPEPVEEVQPEQGQEDIPAVQVGYMEDFDSGGQGWEAFSDDAGAGQLDFALVSDSTYEGDYALQIRFHIEPQGWATYARFFDAPQDWRAYQGLGFALQSAVPGNLIDIHVFAGSDVERESYTYELETTANMRSWTLVAIPWGDFTRVAWEENPGTPFSKTSQVVGIAFGFPDRADPPNRGEVWLDSIHVWTGEPGLPLEADQGEVETVDEVETPPEEQPQSRGLPFCGGIFALPLTLAACGVWRKHTGRKRID